MGASDGTVVGPTKVVDHGADGERWNLVVIGDGFRSTEQAAFESAVTAFTTALQATKPFDDAWERINVHRIDVHSTESGADNPTTCADASTAVAPTGTKATFLDAAFCNNDIRRLLTVDAALAVTTANDHVSGWDAIVVVVNHTEYGGSGGQVAVYSLAASAIEIAIHEMGHSAFKLADEYEYYVGCGSDTDRDNHPATEPTEPNVTIETDRAKLKWRHLVDSATDVPTQENDDCTVCNPDPNPVTATTVGLFEGAHYYHCDAYRPLFDCRMRTISQTLFCPVCQEAIKKKITETAKSTCFVASAVYRDPLHRDVILLQRWRDRLIASRGPAAAAMRLVSAVYAAVGPRLAAATLPHRRLARALRVWLFEPAVSVLRRAVGDLPPKPFVLPAGSR